MNYCLAVYPSHDETLYFGFDKQLNKFVEIKIIHKNTEENVIKLLDDSMFDINHLEHIILNQRCYFLNKNCLYELEWFHEFDDDIPTLALSRHIGWISDIKRIYHCGPYGIAIEFNRWWDDDDHKDYNKRIQEMDLGWIIK